MASCRNFVKDNPRGGKQVSTSPTNSPRYKTSQIEKDGEIWFCLPSLFVCLVSKYYLLLCKTFYSYLCWSEANYDTLDKYTKSLLSSSLLFSCRAKRLNRGASVPPQQGVKIPVWWYSPTPNNATLTKQSMMIFISCYWEGGKTQVSFTSISRNYMYSQKKPITLFYEYLKISFTLYLHVPEH